MMKNDDDDEDDDQKDEDGRILKYEVKQERELLALYTAHYLFRSVVYLLTTLCTFAAPLCYYCSGATILLHGCIAQKFVVFLTVYVKKYNVLALLR